MFPFTPHTTLRLNIVRAVPSFKEESGDKSQQSGG